MPKLSLLRMLRPRLFRLFGLLWALLWALSWAPEVASVPTFVVTYALSEAASAGVAVFSLSWRECGVSKRAGGGEGAGGCGGRSGVGYARGGAATYSYMDTDMGRGVRVAMCGERSGWWFTGVCTLVVIPWHDRFLTPYLGREMWRISPRLPL